MGRFISADPFEGELEFPASLHRYIYSVNDPVSNTDPSGEMSLGETGAAGNVSGTLSSISQHSLSFLIRKTLFGNPKKGEFGIVGDLIMNEMMAAVVDIRFHPDYRGKSNTSKGKGAHAILQTRIGVLNKWLKGVPMAKDVEVKAEISLDKNGKPSFARDSFRLDVVVYFKG